MQEQAQETSELAQILLAPSNVAMSGEFVAASNITDADMAVCKAACNGNCSG